MKLNIGQRIKDHIRVLKVAKKPTRDELSETLKICAVGLLAVGAIGFLVYLVSTLFLA